MKLDGKKIVLTGGASGIGLCILNELMQFDVEVVVADLTELKNEHPRISYFKADLSDEAGNAALFDFAIEKFGHIDLFIANAGFAYYEKVEQEDWERLNRIYKTNVFAPIYTAYRMARINKGRPYAVYITASLMAYYNIPGYAIYGSTKASLHSWASVWDLEHSDQGTLGVIYPVATKTKFFESAANNVPQIWPTQTAEVVGRKVVKGILAGKRRIFPSYLSLLTLLCQHIFPWTMTGYLLWMKRKLEKWSAFKKLNTASKSTISSAEESAKEKKDKDYRATS